MDTRTRPGRIDRRPSLLRRVIVSALGVGLVVSGLAVGATVALAGPRDGFVTGGPSVGMIDGRGHVVDPTSHVLDVTAAYPGMPAQRSELRLQNTGSVPAAFDVTALDLVTTGRESLDRVLVITVNDGSTGRILYRGRLSKLEFAGSGSVKPGSSAAYDVAVTWPGRDGDTNLYQGATISFTVRASAHESAA
jgi:hypothetical protein